MFSANRQSFELCYSTCTLANLASLPTSAPSAAGVVALGEESTPPANALVGITEALRLENAHLGVECTVIEPGFFRTYLLSGCSKVNAVKLIDDLRPVMDPVRNLFAAIDKKQPGDPAKAPQLIVEALTKSGRYKGRPLPLRLPIGRDAVQINPRKHSAAADEVSKRMGRPRQHYRSR